MTRKIITKIFIAAILFFPAITWGQDTPTKGVKDGWAIHVGTGNMYGGNAGVLGERQILLKEKFRISPYVGLGVAGGGTDSISQKKYYWLGYTAGLNLEFGKKHRIIFGPHFIGHNLIGNSDLVKKNSRVAASFILGYKGTADFGLIWEVYIGDIYTQDDDAFSDNMTYSHNSHFGLGLGYIF